jgi:hypothetical protein
MPEFSAEAVIAVVGVVTTLPPSVALLWHGVRRQRQRRDGQAEQDSQYETSASLDFTIR